MSPGLETWLSAKAQALDARGLTRQTYPRGPAAVSGSRVLDLASNDYLGLSQDPRVVAAGIEALRQWGAGATGSRLVTGTTRLHEDLEHRLASWCEQPAALVFSSGYLANLGVVTALSDPGTLVVIDGHSHASLLDAARLSRARVETVAHNDVAAAESLLRHRQEPRALVVTESVFSVLGDQAPLGELARTCEELDAVLLVDEAHALGVTGSGRGSVAAAGLGGVDHVVVTATLSKALGSQGGVVLGSARLREHLVNRARTFMFDTALAPSAVAAALAALEVVSAEPERLAAVHRVAQRLADACRVPHVAGAVLSVPMEGPANAVSVAEACLDDDVRVGIFRPPSVPDGVSRLRLTACATLGEVELTRACEVLAANVRSAA